MPAQRRRLEQSQVLREAMAAISEHGLAELTMAGLARRLGTSGGHIMYYFGSKDQLLVETLRWSEEQLIGPRAAALAEDLPAADRLSRFIDLYLPTRTSDPRWVLWVEVWSRAPADPAILAVQSDLDRAWRGDLEALLAAGIAQKEFRPVPVADYATRLAAMLDGFSVQLVIGAPGVSRTEISRLVGDHVAATLLEE
jgi:AcrR family transcriptional regulator